MYVHLSGVVADAHRASNLFDFQPARNAEHGFLLTRRQLIEGCWAVHAHRLCIKHARNTQCPLVRRGARGIVRCSTAELQPYTRARDWLAGLEPATVARARFGLASRGYEPR